MTGDAPAPADQPSVADSGALAFGGDVTITGGVAAGRDVIIDRLTVLVDDGPPFGDAAARPGAPADVCPYPGIAAFGPRQEAFFFGREADRDAIIEQLRTSRFVAVVGASGTGKSSLLQAGVVPALARGDAGPPKQVVTLRPGAWPSARFQEERDHRHGGSTVWIVDQLEELFASSVEPTDRAAFLELLRAELDPDQDAVQDAAVIVALRSDFYPRLEGDAWLATSVAASQHWLLPLDGAAIRDIVVRPAEAVGLRVEPALLDEIARDVDPAANQLPLLAYALRETWLRRRNGWLTIAGYRDAGGVAKGLQQGVDAVWAGLDGSQRACAKRIFLRLSHVGAGQSPTRRRATVASLVTEDDDLDAVLAVLERFTRARLLTAEVDPTTREATVDITHEALLREWSELRGWLADDASAQRLLDDLTTATDAWDEAGRPAELLLPPSRVAAVEEARRRGLLSLNEDERALVAASRKRAHRDRRRVRALVVLAVAVVAATLTAALVVAQQRQTLRRKRVSDSLQLAAESRSLLGHQRDAAALVALASVDVDRSPLTEGAVIDATASTSGPVAFLTPPDFRVNALAASLGPNGEIVAGSADGLVRVLDPSTGAEVGPALTGHRDAISSVALASDGSVVSGAADGRVAVHRLGNPQPVAVLAGPTDPIAAVAYDPSAGVVLAAAGSQLWRWSMPSLAARLPIDVGAPVAGIALADALDDVVAVTVDGDVHRYDVATGALVDDLAPVTGATTGATGTPGVTIDADSRAFVTDGRSVARWDLASDTPTVARAAARTGARVAVRSPTEDVLFVGSDDGQIETWGVEPQPFKIGEGRGGLTAPVKAIATDGATLVGLDESGHLLAWDVAARASPARTVVAHSPDAVRAVAAGPDGVLAVGGGDGVVWLVRPGQPAVDLYRASTPIDAVAWRPGGDIVAGLDDGSLVAVPSNGPVQVLRAPSGQPITAIAVDRSGALAYGQRDGQVVVQADGKTAEVSVPADVTSVALSPGGRLLAVGSTTDPAVHLWRLDHGSLTSEAKLEGHHLGVYGLAFSPDGRLLASGSDDHDIRLWSSSGAPVAVLVGHTDLVRALAFSPDGSLLASGGEDGSVRLWDVPSRRGLGQPLVDAPQYVWAIAVSSDGSTLAVADETFVVLWPFSDAAWRARACTLAHRDLTAAEWAQLAPDQRPRRLCP